MVVINQMMVMISNYLITLTYGKAGIQGPDAGIKKWRPAELNCGHTDFQSVALPTELGRLAKSSDNLLFFRQLSN